MTKPGGLAWFGATLVWVMAAVMSFAGLRDLADTCGVSHAISWLLPLVIDMGVLVAAWVWRRGVNPAASKLAGRLTWSLLCLTVAGNATELGMRASHITPPWWVAALVGAIPPAVAGATAHLLVLLGRTDVALSDTYGQHDGEESVTTETPTVPSSAPSVGVCPPAPSRPSQLGPEARGPKRKPSILAPTPDSSPTTTAQELLAAGAGRRRLSRELGISEYEARVLLDGHKAEAQPKVTPSRGDDAVTAPRNGHRVLEDA